jgi:hypothetical protein
MAVRMSVMGLVRRNRTGDIADDAEPGTLLAPKGVEPCLYAYQSPAVGFLRAMRAKGDVEERDNAG